MPFTVPSLDEVHEAAIADFQNRFPDADVSRYSDNWKRLRVLAGAVSGLHAHVDSVHDDVMPDTAAGIELDRHGSIYGVTRKPATPARKAAALRVTGTEGSSVTTGNQLVHADGTRYQVNGSFVIDVGDTFVDVDVVAIDTGSATRKNKGETLTFVSPPAGIDGVAELQLDLDEDGDDQESDGAYRVRILDKIAEPGMGGNTNDYRQWALEVTGIASAFVYPLRQGLGSIDIAALHAGQGSVRLLTLGERTELLDYVNARRPVSVADFRVLNVIELPTNIEIVLTPEDDSAYRFDWDDTTPLSVTSYTAGTRVLKFTTARPADMKVGDRIVYKNVGPPYNDGHELVVEALGPAADEVTLTENPSNPPEALNPVYSGGPLVQPVRQAILDHLNSMGPARGAFAAGLWEDTIRTAKLFKVAQLVTGVLDSTVLAPASNVVPTNTAPNPDIYLATPARVLVRRG